MRAVWAYPSFLDYRIPVYQEVDRLLDHQFTLVYSKNRTIKRVQQRLEAVLGPRAVGLDGEHNLTIGNPSSGWANRNLNIPYQPGLLKTLLKLKVDVVIVDGFFQWTPAAILKKLLHRVPLVVNYQKTSHTERNCPWWRHKYRKAVIRRVDAMVCNGRLSKQYAMDLGMAEAAIFTGGNPAETDKIGAQYAAVTKAQKEELCRRHQLNHPTFLCVGRVIPIKGVAELLRGWAGYKANGQSPGKLLIVGEGYQVPELERRVKHEGIRDVIFAGGVPYQSIASYYAIADALMMPGLEDNWSLVVPEAMACGLPIACSRYNGCWPELIHDKVNGIVFDPLNPQEIVDAIAFFGRNPDRLAGMGRASQRIVAEFTPERAARAVVAACQFALKSKHHR